MRDVFVQKLERSALLVARRLVDQDGQAAEFGTDLLRRKEVQPRGQDRRFQDRVFGTVEPKKVADSALGDDMAGDRRPRRARTCPSRRPWTSKAKVVGTRKMCRFGWTVHSDRGRRERS